MRIEQASLSFASSHTAMEAHVVKRTLRMEISRPSNPQNISSQQPSIDDKKKAESLTDQIKHQIEDDPKWLLIRILIEKLTGKKIKFFSRKELENSIKNLPPVEQPEQQGQNSAPTIRVEITNQEIKYQSEQTTFSARGTIQTAGGEDISFNLNFSLNREFLEARQTNLELSNAPKAKDPLIIHLPGAIPQISDNRFTFDLNSDGNTEQIATPGPMSGFLAFDKNNDGKINNGSELFGPATGNGFEELAQYDADHNGWIDEFDPIYNSLKFWQPGNGAEKPVSIKQQGVGAIYLGHTATPFTYTDQQNKLEGQLQTSGVYLASNGQPGAIQQVDLFV